MSETIHITKQLSLRPLQESDAQELFSLADDNRAYLREWLPWLDKTQTCQDTLEFIKLSIDQDMRGQSPVFAITYEDRIAGVIGYHAFDTENQIASIGYWLSEDTQGQGIITRACQALVHHALVTLNMNRVEIRAATENLKSRSVAERLGFVQEGILRNRENLYGTYVDHVMYSMLKAEYTPMSEDQLL